MARKKKKSNPLFILVSLLLVVVAVVLWFVLEPIKHNNLDATISYVQGTFGYSETLLGIEKEMLNFSVLNLLPLVLMGLMVLVLLVGFFSPKSMKPFQVKGIVLIFAVVSIVLLMFFTNFVNEASILLQMKDYKLQVEGFIVPGLLLASGVINFLGL